MPKPAVRLAFVALGLTAFILAAGTGAASHCSTWSSSPPHLLLVGADGGITYYVFHTHNCRYPGDAILPCNDIYEYRESNGIAGLQRGDPIVDNTCHGMINRDTLLNYHRNMPIPLAF